MHRVGLRPPPPPHLVGLLQAVAGAVELEGFHEALEPGAGEGGTEGSGMVG